MITKTINEAEDYINQIFDLEVDLVEKQSKIDLLECQLEIQKRLYDSLYDRVIQPFHDLDINHL